MEMSNLNRQAGKVHAVGAIMAGACVVGLVGLLLLHGGQPAMQFAAPTLIGPTTAVADTAFLHAPAMAIPVPSADRVFASPRDASQDDAPAAPTF
jgi:hypothetical protein